MSLFHDNNNHSKFQGHTWDPFSQIRALGQLLSAIGKCHRLITEQPECGPHNPHSIPSVPLYKSKWLVTPLCSHGIQHAFDAYSLTTAPLENYPAQPCDTVITRNDEGKKLSHLITYTQNVYLTEKNLMSNLHSDLLSSQPWMLSQHKQTGEKAESPHCHVLAAHFRFPSSAHSINCESENHSLKTVHPAAS